MDWSETWGRPSAPNMVGAMSDAPKRRLVADVPKEEPIRYYHGFHVLTEDMPRGSTEAMGPRLMSSTMDAVEHV